MLTIQDNRILWGHDGETLLIEPFGISGLRVRCTRNAEFSGKLQGLLPREPETGVIFFQKAGTDGFVPHTAGAEEVMDKGSASMVNGGIRVLLNDLGKLAFETADGKPLLREYEYDHCSSLKIISRELKANRGGNFRASLKLESDPSEKLYGMGQYQNGLLNLKGSFLELAQKNSQVSIPFVLSSLGYGFLWNNPAIGRATFGTNMTQWEAESTPEIDFWITAGDSPEQIHRQFMDAVGKPPMMPEHGLGFWQCKLRYRTQEELLEVAREYHRRGIPLDVIVADFFHWTLEGTWAFDPQYWPDPRAMVEELDAMGTRLMVSIWPSVSVQAPNYDLLRDRGFLVRAETGVNISMMCFDSTAFMDVTNPQARKFFWEQLEKGYVQYGIRDFWLDVAEPEYTSYDFENYRYHQGPALEISNQYPRDYARMIWDGLHQKNPKEDVVSLLRCAWVGSQRYGALVWSGDIDSSFEALKNQIVCGLQMGLAGIPWWTTDIGGFNNGDVSDPKFQELLIRWFQYGCFCPVMRIHGNRNPSKPPMSTVGGGRCWSGADNEIWSYGEENCKIMEHYIRQREAMRDYTRSLMAEAAETGAPVMRPLFYAFPEDKNTWEISDQFLFGDRYLVAPVTEYLCRSRNVYLPAGARWQEQSTGRELEGGQTVCADAPLETIPVFCRI